MLVALPSAVAFGVAITSPLGGSLAAAGAVAGMVGAVLLGVINPLLGGTQRLISAPCAPAAAVMGALAGELASQHDATTALLLMTAVAVVSGGLQLAYGVIGGGKVIKYIPYPAVSGFMSGVAVLIFVKQLPGLLGLPAGTKLGAALSQPGSWNTWSIVVGGSTILGVVLAPRLTRRVPAAIIGLSAGALAYFALSRIDPALATLEGNRMVVGPINASFGSLLAGLGDRASALSTLRWRDAGAVIVPALTLSALLSIDTLKTCVVVDAMTRTRHDSNKELRAQGIGNAASAIFGGIPGAGTMGATLVNVTSGGMTRRSGVIEGGLCLVVFVLLGSVVSWIPIAALSGILLVIAVRMVDAKSFRLVRQRSTLVDFGVILAVVVVAVSVGLVEASATGFVLAALLFVREHMSASVVRRKTDGSRVFSKQRRLPDEMAVLEREGRRTTICEVQGNLFFGTTDKLFTELAQDLGRQDYVVLDLRRVQGVDFTAARMLDQMDVQLEEHEGRLVLAGVPANLPTGRDLRGYFADLRIGSGSGGIEIFDDLDAALEWIEDRYLLEQLGERAERNVPLEFADMDLFREIEERGLLPNVVECADQRSFRAGDTIFRKDSEGDELFVIRRGTVRILVPLDGAKGLHVASFGRGDFFGDMAFLDRQARSADAVALTDVDLYVLSRERFDRLSREHPVVGVQVFARLARALSIRLRHTDAEVTALMES